MIKISFSGELARATSCRNCMISDTTTIGSRDAAICELIQMIYSTNANTVDATARVIDHRDVQALAMDGDSAIQRASVRLLRAINQTFGPRLGINPADLQSNPFRVAQTILSNREKSTEPLNFAERAAALRSRRFGRGVRILPESATPG